MTATYAWLIIMDHIADLAHPSPSNMNAVGMKGPHNIDPKLEARLDAGEGVRFRMYDDDDELYYEGRLVLADKSEELVVLQESEHFKMPLVASLPEEAFGPLNDFGTPNAGATSIHFKAQELNRWGML